MTDPARELTLTIQKVVFGGDGLGSVEGKACFVEGALPGEKVRVRIESDRKNHFKAKLLEVLEPSPHRVAPPCEYVGHCGGCQYQHVTYEEELRIKAGQVAETFTHALKLDPSKIKPIRHTGSEYGYRNSVTLHSTSRDLAKAQPLGFIGKDNATPSVIRRCMLVDERLSEVFQKTHLLPPERRRMTFKLSEKGEIMSDRSELYFRVKIGGREILTSSEGFFQNNLAVTELVAAQVREWTARFAPKTFVDLYAGVGTFTLLSGAGAELAVCLEESRTSFECLKFNMKQQRKPGSYRLIRGRVEDTFPFDYASGRPERAVIFMDPPRQGVQKEFAEFIGQIDPPLALVYLSCDLATLARDLKLITAAGRLKVEEAVPFDMFPRTKHIETAVLLVPTA